MERTEKKKWAGECGKRILNPGGKIMETGRMPVLQFDG
jgi:hypothetical protein